MGLKFTAFSHFESSFSINLSTYRDDRRFVVKGPSKRSKLASLSSFLTKLTVLVVNIGSLKVFRVKHCIISTCPCGQFPLLRTLISPQSGKTAYSFPSCANQVLARSGTAIFSDGITGQPDILSGIMCPA
ncbi:MAG TPA: hypothetical protein DIW81_24310 [Planctomycetaceae bacterium]|nr:hypothetical protein [Rubinisphaera sp.]HCS54671.1 hypothetical protein [Planctomycetaceae bacterium]